ncbi:MAG: hypothetical protein HPY66_2558 [Firmicutes bacterium]|nr:hypothetical protein [Bacillota bacterium]
MDKLLFKKSINVFYAINKCACCIINNTGESKCTKNSLIGMLKNANTA